MFWEAFWGKLQDLSESEATALKHFLHQTIEDKKQIDKRILKHFYKEVQAWLETSQLHLLQKKSIEKLAIKLLEV